MKFRKHYDYDVEAASDEAGVANKLPSLTVQAHAEDADINVLMHRFGITGKMPENPRIPQYGDFTSITDYRSALHAIDQANSDFMQLPASVRARFDNDPQQLLMFVQDDRNLDEARKLGLLKEVISFAGTTGPDPGVGAAGGAPGGSASGNPGSPSGVGGDRGAASGAAAGKGGAP